MENAEIELKTDAVVNISENIPGIVEQQTIENKVKVIDEHEQKLMELDSGLPTNQTEVIENNLNENTMENVTKSTVENTKNQLSTNNAIVLTQSSNNSLSLLAQYTSSDSSESASESTDSDEEAEIAEQISNECVENKNQSAADELYVLQKIQQHITSGPYRVASSSSDSEISSSNSSDVEEIPTREELDEFLDEDAATTTTSKGPIKSIGELGIEDLPPIEDLKITVAEDECIELGKIISIVEQLVLVDSLPKTVPLNLDTVLFLQKGQKAMGKIFDVLGNVTSPIYCVRFNSHKEIMEKQIQIGETVYVAPRTEHTSFVILSELMKDKGTDASHENDNENTSNSEYSDDETERQARAKKLTKNKTNLTVNNEQSKRPKMFKNNRGGTKNNQSSRGGGRGGFNRQPQNNFQHPANYNYSWHSNYQHNSGSNSFYPNPYARPIRQSMQQQQQPYIFSVPTTLLQTPPPPPPPPTPPLSFSSSQSQPSSTYAPSNL